MKAADFSVTANNFILVVDVGHTRISTLKPSEYELRFVTLVLSEGIFMDINHLSSILSFL